MWKAHLELKYEDSVMGKRCQRFKISTLSSTLPPYSENNKSFQPYLETIDAKENKIQILMEDLEADELITNIERESNTIFFIKEISKAEHNPRKLVSPKVFFPKPIKINNKGLETWEVASFHEQSLKDEIVKLQKDHLEFKHTSTEKHPLSDIYSQAIMPHLTPSQESAIKLATAHGYYQYPRKTELERLAIESKIALSTFREHLRKAEKKIMEDLLGKPIPPTERLEAPNPPKEKPKST